MIKVALNIVKPHPLLWFLTIVSSVFVCIANVAIGQTTIMGFICDEHASPYAGANILLNNTSGTVSDAEGKFIFTRVKTAWFTLTITAIGYKDVYLSGKTDTLSNLHVVMSPAIAELDQVTVIDNAAQILKQTESFPVQLVGEGFLREAQESNLMQTLNNIPGVSSMDVGTGISKPMIRGLGYYRVVVAQNGIKYEGQQWSNHHGISIDQQSVRHVEVIKGPASLQYGSDAIGGVINILPLNVPAEQGIDGEVSLTAKSNTQRLGGAAEFTLRKRDFYSNITLSYNSFGDFLIPETDSFLLPAPVSSSEASHKVLLGNQIYNTAGRLMGISTTAGIIKKWGSSYIEFNYFGTENGFFDWQGIQYDSIKALHDRQRRDILLPWQKVNNYSVHHFTNRYFDKSKLEIDLGYQLNDSREFSHLVDRTGNRQEELEYFRSEGNYELGLLLQTLSANGFYTLNKFKDQVFKFGLNTQYQFHQTNGYGHILPEYTRFSVGFFLTYNYTITPNWIFNSGVRIDFTVFSMDEALNPDVAFGDSIFNPAFQKTYPGAAFSVGVNYLPGSNTILKVNAGKSYRVPSAYELGAYGMHRHEGRFEKGNTGNEPEQAWQFDLGVEQKWKYISIQLSPFLNYFTNYLFLNPTPELRPEGQVNEYRQTRALITGTEASVEATIGKRVAVNAGLEYVYAVNLDLQSALPFTPPFLMQTELSYLFKDIKTFVNSKAGIELVTAAAQNYTVPNELSTPGYTIINLLALTTINLGRQQINLILKVRNLFNTAYFNHLSFYRRLRIPEPGRDVQIMINIPINN